MSVFQAIQSEVINKFARDNKEMNQSRYALASETGLDGPDQVLPADVDTTCDADGRVRIKLDSNGHNSCMPVSIPGVFIKTAKLYPDHIALVSRLNANGKRTMYTFQEYESTVRTVAKAFLKLGLERHHSVCIMGYNSPEWFISHLATIYAGGFATGIYTTNSPEACQYCAEHSRANIIVVEDEKQLQKILQIKHNLPDLKAIVQYEGIPTKKNILSWDDLLNIGKNESEDKLQSVLKTIGANECCTLVYTSGTVGNPKAVMLSHDNLLHELRILLPLLQLKEKSETLISYLPLSHVAAQLLDIITNIMMAATVYFADPSALKDMPLLEAYGMTECSGAHSVINYKEYSMEGVGRPLTGLYTKLDNIDEHGEGEICMSGRHIFMGYLNEPEKTEEAKDKNGWLHSADLGKFNSNGIMFITGRIKELIITSGGENVAPYNIEQVILSELSYLSNAMVVGDKKKYLTVLVTLKSKINGETGEPLDMLNSDVLKWANSIGSNAQTVTEIINSRDPVIYAEIENAIKRANTQAISNAQKVQKFEILPHDFSIPTGELGPTLKLKKNVVLKMYADLIDKMYE